jgi:hypothetical protein
MMNEIDQAYTKWVEDPNPQSMAQVVKALSPTINSEIQQFSGPKQLLRQRAKILTIKAVKNYDPLSKAKLRSWVVTNMQPLKRYNKQLFSTAEQRNILLSTEKSQVTGF